MTDTPDLDALEAKARELIDAIQHHNREREDAWVYAHRALDEPNADPDDELRTIARQLVRSREREVRARDLLANALPWLISRARRAEELEAAVACAQARFEDGLLRGSGAEPQGGLVP